MLTNNRNGMQCYRSCSRDTVLKERKGYFGSKTGSGVSLTSKTCQWAIPATTDERVYLTVQNGSTVNCQEEFVFIYENSSEGEKLLKAFCGKRSVKLITKKNGMIIRFITRLYKIFL